MAWHPSTALCAAARKIDEKPPDLNKETGHAAVVSIVDFSNVCALAVELKCGRRSMRIGKQHARRSMLSQLETLTGKR